ncbi:protein mono-ADP-ribosyltransferase PARP12-like isoform X2 [Mugil cephalus]|uniref:protein mono-ADP-ribosyltransferase PARP12-like isoform X2 n=1 Tax=Mugil cephalus TaxID=48193 RepID=UPI001FB5C199|nr:protein mono-ADP-ribosyltransferase PARP12-like isoform X2 [Mugil cephalus]
MTSAISQFITKTLCENQGSLDFKQLKEKLQLVTRSDNAAEEVQRLVQVGRVAIQHDKQGVSGTQTPRPHSLVVAKTNLRLCQKKSGECLQCDGLHLCRYFVCGDCSFGPKCKNPHSLASPCNAELLRRHDHHGLTEKQLFQLLLQNDPFLLPEICPHYNKGNGVHGSCKFATSCTKLHVCQHYFQGDCKFGSSCKRSHNVDAHGTKLFRGFSQENIENVHKIYRNKLIIVDQNERQSTVNNVRASPQQASFQPRHTIPVPRIISPEPVKNTSDADKNEICLYFIRRHCSFKEKCARVHWHLPYRWQLFDQLTNTWKDLVNMEEIEKAYCDPSRETSSASPAQQSVNFMTMTLGGSPVRRLSTASSVSKPPHYILTTQWVWYWKDETGIWMQFGQSGATVTSQTLENVYLAERDTQIPFSAGKQQYVLHFKDALGGERMYQQNVKYKTKRDVRRRPHFVSAQDVEVKLKSTSSQSSSSSTAENVPSQWDKSALPEFGYKLVPLPISEEYNDIKKLFMCTMPQSTIIDIQRIQNASLWNLFQWQEDQMKKRNGGRVDKKHLFHGTDESLVEAICEQNFDWRMCGVHGTAYGKGSYFARDASYSNRYAKAKRNGTKVMFVAQVLVGDYTRGRSSYVRPPPKGSSKILYDSCVDNKTNPGIYVIFEKQQIYPEYIISYS